MPTKAKQQRNPQDATLRNVRAAAKRNTKQDGRLDALEAQVQEQGRRLDALENEVASLSEDAGRAFVPFGDGDEGED